MIINHEKAENVAFAEYKYLEKPTIRYEHMSVVIMQSLHFATSSNADSNGTYKTKEWLERVLIIGINKPPSSITISSGTYILTNVLCFINILSDEGKQDLRFKYNSAKKILEIKKPGLNISKDFAISLK